MKNLRFDMGQIDLICEIFKDNLELLHNFDTRILNEFLYLIEHEGR
jgi:hypothetical protein